LHRISRCNYIVTQPKYKGCDNIVTVVTKTVRKEILGEVERKVLEAYLRGERLKTYNVLLARIRHMGLKAIIDGCERDLVLLKKLLRVESARA
jgi:hypothetical protein